MRERRLRALCLAVLVHAVASCGSRVSAQDPEDCEPITVSSVTRVADRFSLTPAQRKWLLDRQRAGRLEDPSDLDSLPEAGPGLLEDLSGAFCWGTVWGGEARMSSRQRAGEGQREIQAGLETASLSFRARGRRRFDAARELRTCLDLRRSGWEVLLGHVRSRSALGLLLATPGAELRGGAALGPATSGWGSSVSLDPDLPRGAVIGRGSPDGGWQLAAVHGTRGWWGTGEWRRQGDRRAFGTAVIRGTEGPAAHLWIHETPPEGGWTAEWVWGVSGSSRGASWSTRSRRLGIRAGLSHRSASFHVPEIRSIAEPRNEESVAFNSEVRWRPGTGRFLVFRFEDGRKPDRPWMRVRTVREVEWGERLAVGLRLALLWRSTSLETREPREEEQRLRGELAYVRREWRLRVRIEERVSATGKVRFRSLRAGRRGRVSWEIRVDRLSETGSGPRVWVYRRRAGGVYGWDSWSTGNWLGGWLEVQWEGVDLEISADTGTRGWDWIGAVQIPIGRLDPGGAGS